MKLYKTTITPKSYFATPLKGDTVFGQICWSIIYRFGEDRLKTLLKSYENTPFLIVSDSFAPGFLPKPKMPSKLLNEKSEEKKQNRKKTWLTMKELEEGRYEDARTDSEVDEHIKVFSTMHNSINYKTFHTGEGFDPYGVESYHISPKEIYFLIDEELFSKKELEKTLEIFAMLGYGKDTTVGKGRFVIDKLTEVEIKTATTCMTLSPFTPQGLEYEELFYEPFVRFGKFGGDRAMKNAFKKPLLLADTASVIKLKEKPKKPYLGSAIKDISNLYKDAVHQGYSIVIPIKDFA